MNDVTANDLMRWRPTATPSAPVIGSLLNDYQGQTVALLLGLFVILIMIFKPGGLNGVWLAVRRGVTRWPYSS